MRARGPITPRAFRTVAWWALAAQIGIVVTGAAVRLTGSGLGCSDWPGCSEDRLVPEWSFHGWVEFGNRLLTFVVTATAVAAVIGARRRAPRRRELSILSWVLVGGVMAQALIGGVLVLFELDPRLTVLHFVASVVLISAGVLLVHRSAADGGLQGSSVIGLDDAHRGDAQGGPASLRLAALTLGVLVAVVVGTGTVVTGSGPHGGDERAERFGFDLSHVTQVHAAAMWVFVAVLVITAVLVVRAGPAATWLRPNVQLLVALTTGQAVVGYVQYALGVPAGLVALHVFGSAMVWASAVALVLKVLAATAEPAPEAVLAAAGSGAGPRAVLSER